MEQEPGPPEGGQEGRRPGQAGPDVRRRAPRGCPVCGDALVLTRLSCDACGTELSGHFEACEFCAVSPDDRGLLRVFLASRGNMKELERHLGVSYPTARSRFDALLARLGIDRPAALNPRVEVLDSLGGDVADADEARRRLH